MQPLRLAPVEENGGRLLQGAGRVLVGPHYMGTTLHYTTLHYTTLHYTTLHYTTLHYTTLHYTTLHYTTLHYTTPHHTTLHYTTLHYTTLHYTTLHYTTLHYTTLHYTTLNYTTLHYTTLHYTTPHPKTQHNTTQHHITLHHITPYAWASLFCSVLDEVACEVAGWAGLGLVLRNCLGSMHGKGIWGVPTKNYLEKVVPTTPRNTITWKRLQVGGDCQVGGPFW